MLATTTIQKKTQIPIFIYYIIPKKRRATSKTSVLTHLSSFASFSLQLHTDKTDWADANVRLIGGNMNRAVKIRSTSLDELITDELYCPTIYPCWIFCLVSCSSWFMLTRERQVLNLFLWEIILKFLFWCKFMGKVFVKKLGIWVLSYSACETSIHLGFSLLVWSVNGVICSQSKPYFWDFLCEE